MLPIYRLSFANFLKTADFVYDEDYPIENTDRRPLSSYYNIAHGNEQEVTLFMHDGKTLHDKTIVTDHDDWQQDNTHMHLWGTRMLSAPLYGRINNDTMEASMAIRFHDKSPNDPTVIQNAVLEVVEKFPEAQFQIYDHNHGPYTPNQYIKKLYREINSASKNTTKQADYGGRTPENISPHYTDLGHTEGDQVIMYQHDGRNIQQTEVTVTRGEDFDPDNPQYHHTWMSDRDIQNVVIAGRIDKILNEGSIYVNPKAKKRDITAIQTAIIDVTSLYPDVVFRVFDNTISSPYPNVYIRELEKQTKSKGMVRIADFLGDDKEIPANYLDIGHLNDDTETILYMHDGRQLHQHQVEAGRSKLGNPHSSLWNLTQAVVYGRIEPEEGIGSVTIRGVGPVLRHHQILEIQTALLDLMGTYPDVSFIIYKNNETTPAETYLKTLDHQLKRYAQQRGLSYTDIGHDKGSTAIIFYHNGERLIQRTIKVRSSDGYGGDPSDPQGHADLFNAHTINYDEPARPIIAGRVDVDKNIGSMSVILRPRDNTKLQDVILDILAEFPDVAFTVFKNLSNHTTPQAFLQELATTASRDKKDSQLQAQSSKNMTRIADFLGKTEIPPYSTYMDIGHKEGQTVKIFMHDGKKLDEFETAVSHNIHAGDEENPQMHKQKWGRLAVENSILWGRLETQTNKGSISVNRTDFYSPRTAKELTHIFSALADVDQTYPNVDFLVFDGETRCGANQYFNMIAKQLKEAQSFRAKKSAEKKESNLLEGIVRQYADDGVDIWKKDSNIFISFGDWASHRQEVLDLVQENYPNHRLEWDFEVGSPEGLNWVKVQ